MLTQASPNKPVVVFIRDMTTGGGGQPEVTSSGDVDRRHGILRIPMSLATARSPSDSDTNSGDSGKGPSCDEAPDPANNNSLRVTTTGTTTTTILQLLHQHISQSIDRSILVFNVAKNQLLQGHTRLLQRPLGQ